MPNRKVVKASILYNMIGGYFILLFVFDSSWFRSLGEWADCVIVINSRGGGGGRDINCESWCEGNRFDFAMMPRENYEEMN